MASDPTFTRDGTASVGQFYSSGGLNDSTGREPFEDTSRDYIHGQGNTSSTIGTGTGIGSGITSGHHHHEHQHHSHSQPDQYTTGTTSGIGSGIGSGLGSSDYNTSSTTGGGLRDHLVEGSRGDIKAGTSADPAVSEGKYTGYGIGATNTAGGVGRNADQSIMQGAVGGLTGDQYISGNQTGDSYGGIQTGSTSFGTGENVAEHNKEGLVAKIKDTISGHKHDNTTGTSGVTEHTGRSGNNDMSTRFDPVSDSTTGQTHHLGTTGAATGAAATGLAAAEGHHHSHHTGTTGSTTYGSNTAAGDYDRSTSGLDTSAGYGRDAGGPGNMGVGQYQGGQSGVLSSGAAGTDRFDVDRASSGVGSSEYGNPIGDKGSNDHSATRTGRDFTGGDTAAGAYSDPYAKTGLTGRENTTSGVQDMHGESTAHESSGGGLLSKVKGMLGGHTNTTHADHK